MRLHTFFAKKISSLKCRSAERTKTICCYRLARQSCLGGVLLFTADHRPLLRPCDARVTFVCMRASGCLLCVQRKLIFWSSALASASCNPESLKPDGIAGPFNCFYI